MPGDCASVTSSNQKIEAADIALERWAFKASRTGHDESDQPLGRLGEDPEAGLCEDDCTVIVSAGDGASL